MGGKAQKGVLAKSRIGDDCRLREHAAGATESLTNQGPKKEAYVDGVSAAIADEVETGATCQAGF